MKVLPYIEKIVLPLLFYIELKILPFLPRKNVTYYANVPRAKPIILLHKKATDQRVSLKEILNRN